MTEEKILCSQCSKDLVMKFIEFKDLVFCSNYCLDKFIAAMGQKKFFREYGDVFVPGEGKGWVPKYANDYIMMCARCPKKLSETCHENTAMSAAYHDILGESEEYRWCCHARFCLSAAISDGTVTDQPPTINITAPTNGSSYGVGDTVTFIGSSSDTEDGDLSTNIQWDSNLDGFLSTGSTVSSSTLSIGTHTITASVTDSGSHFVSSTVSITITTDLPPVVVISSPTTGASYGEGETVLVPITILD